MTGQANLLQSLGWAVLNSLWQMALLWVVYQALIGLSKNIRPYIKGALASALLIGGFSWFLFTFFSNYYGTYGEPVISATFIRADGNYLLNEWLLKSLPIASVLYLILLIFPLLHFVRNYRYVQVIRQYGLSRINVDWRLFVNRVSKQMNIRRKVQVWISEFVASPVTVGFLKPVILVPLAAVNHLTPQQLEAVLLHELSHIRRFDYFINLVINFIQVILYFNPFVKSFVRIVEREREKSCDEMVLQFQYDSHEYASALLTLEKANRGNKGFAIAVSGKKNDLLHRVELIMGVQEKSFLSLNKLSGLMAGLLCVVAINTFLLLSRPSGGYRAMSLTNLATTVNLVDANEQPNRNEIKQTEQPSLIVHHPAPAPAEPAAVTVAAFADQHELNTDYLNASLELLNTPELKKYQQEQVERTMEASRKVLESVQWKVVEKSIADVFDQREKAVLKESYKKEIEKMDWNRWERKLKLAYDELDWENINSQLASAVNQVRLDSIQLVYNKAIHKLDGITRELTRNEMQGIPDSDISLKELGVKRAEVQRALNDLKRVRSKKIVHL